MKMNIEKQIEKRLAGGLVGSVQTQWGRIEILKADHGYIPIARQFRPVSKVIKFKAWPSMKEALDFSHNFLRFNKSEITMEKYTKSHDDFKPEALTQFIMDNLDDAEYQQQVEIKKKGEQFPGDADDSPFMKNEKNLNKKIEKRLASVEALIYAAYKIFSWLGLASATYEAFKEKDIDQVKKYAKAVVEDLKKNKNPKYKEVYKKFIDLGLV